MPIRDKPTNSDIAGQFSYDKLAFFAFSIVFKIQKAYFLAMVVYLQVGPKEGPKTIIGQKFKP